MIVVGCLNGAGKLSDDLEESHTSPSSELTVCSVSDNKPDLSTLKVFVTSPAQGVCYHAGIWRKRATIESSGLITTADSLAPLTRSLGCDLRSRGLRRDRYSDHDRRKPAHRPGNRPSS